MDAGLPDGLQEALGVRPVEVKRSRFDVLVEVASEKNVRSMAPDFAALAKIDGRGFIVTARADATGETYDFVSRFSRQAWGSPRIP